MKQHTTIELTSKKLKAHYLFACLTLCVCTFLMFTHIGEHEEFTALYAMGSFIGLIWILVTKIRIWWNHS